MTSSFLSFLFTSLGVENVGEAFAYGILKKKKSLNFLTSESKKSFPICYILRRKQADTRRVKTVYVWQTFGNNRTSFWIDFHRFVKTWLFASRLLCTVKQCTLYQHVVTPFLLVPLLDLPFSITRGLSLSLLRLSPIYYKQLENFAHPLKVPMNTKYHRTDANKSYFQLLMSQLLFSSAMTANEL